MKRIAVTGGNGLLGRYVVAALEPDYDVTVIDRTDSDDRKRQPHGAVDVLDLSALGAALNDHDGVVHLAAIDAAIEATPEAFFHTNVTAAWNVMHAGYEAGIRRFSLCSSSSAYGLASAGYIAAPIYLPVDENHPVRATEPYGLSKRSCETVAEGFSVRNGMCVTVLRPCFVAFPHLIEEMVKVYENRDPGHSDGGRPFPLPPLRWFVAPEDAAIGFRLALEANVQFEIFNLSAEDTFTSQPTVDMISELFGEVPPLHGPRRYAQAPHASPMSTEKARAQLGWRPKESWQMMRRRQGGS